VITITEKITEDNYHLLFSAADAQRTSPNEVILVNSDLSMIGKTFNILLPENLMINGHLDLALTTFRCPLPNNLTITGYFNLAECRSLVLLPDNLTVRGYFHLEGCRSLILPDSLKVWKKILVYDDDVDEFKKMNKKFTKKIRKW
jgi:hypothetical protein